MGLFRAIIIFILCGLRCFGATFGTINYHTEPLADMVLDEARKRIYFVNTTLNQVEVYSYSSSASLPLKIASIATDSTPLSAAMSRSGQFLYVTCYNASGLDIIDLGKLQKTAVVTLSAKPEGVAVGFDERVLISTVGASGQDVLVAYNPTAGSANNLQALVVTPAAPAAPQIPPPSNRMYLASQSRLVASPDGTKIAGVNELANNTRTVFVYDATSATVLLSRNVPNLSPVLAISADNTKLMSGPILFDATTLQVLAQQNAANFPYNLPSGAAGSLTTQTNLGGSAFLPDGSALLSALDIVPVESPAAQSDTAQLVFNDPGNLLVSMGLQLPDNPSGKIVVTSDGSTAYVISDSGFLYLPLSSISHDSLAQASSTIALLANDQCGVTTPISSATIPVVNTGSGSRITATATPVTTAILNPTATTGPAGAAAAATTSVAPLSKVVQQGNQANVVLQFNPAAAKNLGTVTPTDFLIQSPQAINIPPDILVAQNNRNAEAAGAIMPVSVSLSAAQGLLDMAQDTTRQRLYIANAGQNRVEIFDMQKQQFLSPIKVGQLPQSLALSEDSSTLYVANAGGENISIVDLTKDAVSGTIPLPPIPFNASFAILTPAAIASTQQGPQVLMSDGSLWKVVGNTLAPRTLNPNIFGTATSIPGPVRAMAASPEGAWVLVLSGTGNAYLYSADVDDFVAVRQVVSGTITGYYGPVAAGPNGQYFLVNNLVLNQALTVVGSNSTTPSIGPTGGGGLPSPSGPTGSARPVSAVAAVSAKAFARFSTPVLATATATPSDAGLIELVDPTSLETSASANALEGPSTMAVGNARVNLTGGRTMTVDPSGKTVYVLTTSGLSVIPIGGATAQNLPQAPGNGVVDTANFQAGIAPGGLVSLFGTNLAASATANAPLPNILGGSCVTLNNTPLPLLATSSTQINAQIPPSLASGRYSLEVRSIANQMASSVTSVTVAKYAPAIFVDTQGPAIFHQDGTRVNQSHPANRDEPLTIYATGLGTTTGGAVVAGQPSPSTPLAVTSTVQVFFGDPSWVQAQLIVDWSGLLPGSIGVYKIQCRVPGFHISGNALPVTLRIGGVSSVSGSSAPAVAVN